MIMLEIPVWGKLILVCSALIGFTAIKHYWPKYKDDNIIEEQCEILIKKETGMDIDLTPESPEK